MRYEEESKKIIELVGGKSNINSLVHCATRLRFSLKNTKKADKEALEKLPYVMSVVNSGGQYQVVIGSKVPDYYAAIQSLADLNEDAPKTEKKLSFNYVFEVISGAFSPLIPAMAGSGMIKAILTILVEMKLLADTSSTYMVLSAASNAIFYFLPVFLGITLTKKIGGNMYVGGVIGAALLEPSFTGMIGQEKLDFLGINLNVVDYATTIFPIFVAIFIYSFVDKFLRKIIFKDLQLFAVPMFSLMIMVPLTALLFGPFGTVIGDALSQGVMWLIGKSALLSGIVLGGGMPFMVMFGLHWGFSPITLENLTVMGGDPIEGMAVAAVFAQIGIAIGFYLKSKKHSKMKALAGPLALTGLFAGVTEPIVYGLILRYKRLLPIVAISGAIGGAICGVTGVTMNAYVFHNIFSIPVYTPKVGYFIGVGAALIAGAVLTYFFGVKEDEMVDFLPETDQGEDDFQEEPATTKIDTETTIYAPMEGTVIPLTEVDDDVFSSEIAGKGVAIIPTSDKVIAPFDGTVVAIFPSKHAIGLKSTGGSELLIHIGINTVNLNGEHFETKVAMGDTITRGQTLLIFDREKIEQEGYAMTSPVILTDAQSMETMTIINDQALVTPETKLFNVGKNKEESK
ncbi:PTS beta-glucoside transporter subunit EIIBCA [Enterococcus ureilyticus]|uniref:PTS system sucrose-specific EIIBCA component n=1 Tax=Enterococcus ureilyticus TaxID=1131292 RepID=A0A1E5H5M5_9ENTE|nr:beta-glucoside-specific PTS transporter subunit IIABC [Enterococcus ureilyticus]MBM7688965.1 PTS system beta-glucosides-specific IIC component [Enterococcus ureilyticus]OEG20231.1 PTS beta-glucoside transporter subunit EIIBCA [Enterococcus ureilyticus]